MLEQHPEQFEEVEPGKWRNRRLRWYGMVGRRFAGFARPRVGL